MGCSAVIQHQSGPGNKVSTYAWSSTTHKLQTFPTGLPSDCMMRKVVNPAGQIVLCIPCFVNSCYAFGFRLSSCVAFFMPCVFHLCSMHCCLHEHHCMHGCVLWHITCDECLLQYHPLASHWLCTACKNCTSPQASVTQPGCIAASVLFIMLC